VLLFEFAAKLRNLQHPSLLVCRYGWIPGMSVGFLEMYTSIIWDKNPNAIVMHRNGAFLSSVSEVATGKDAEAIISAYVAKNENDKESISQFSDFIKTSLPGQVHTYECKVDGRHATDKRRLNLVGLDYFADKVLNFLKQRIDAQYPDVPQTEQIIFDAHRVRHEEFMQQRCGNVVGQEKETAEIEEYIRDTPGIAT
jgi:hypothetical protein